MSKKVEDSLPEGTKIPNHIAMILDGNRRWARSRGLPTLEGHRAGFEAGMKVAQAARDWGVHTFTVWGFSTENWDRSPEEISYLMTLYWKLVEEIEKKAKKEGIRFVHLGRKDRFPKDLIEYIKKVERETKHYTNHVFNAALDYGGHDETLRAVKKVIEAGVPADKLDEKMFASYLDTGDQPYPNVDLFIRTSGEQRTSGFLPWQLHYAEYFWELDHLPDMTPDKLKEAILDYSRRRRRFGGNDKEEHLKFNPKLLAKLELGWRKELETGDMKDGRLRDKLVAYVKEQFGLSKSLAVTAGWHLLKALKHREKSEWWEAKLALIELYGIVRKNLNLALEPELVANLEVNMWREPSEENIRALYAETYRVSDFQASKVAHLATLVQEETGKKDWDKALGYAEKFYRALKERVA